MILSQPLVLAATLPHLINTFGAASVILSPILNMLLFAAAVYLVFHILNIAQQSNLFRDVFSAIGVLSTYNYIQDSLSRSTNRVQSPINGYTPVSPPSHHSHMHGHSRVSFLPTVHPHHSNSSHRTLHMHSDETFSSPSSERSHDSNQSRHMHGH